MTERFKQMGIGLLIITIILGSSVSIGWLIRVVPWIFVVSIVLAFAYQVGGIYMESKRR